MILLCPSCHTRYHHASPATPPPSTAHCSRCNETFPYGEAPRTYVLIPGSTRRGGTTPMPRGMDDPTLARQIQAGTAGRDPVVEQLTPGLGSLVGKGLPTDERVEPAAEVAAPTRPSVWMLLLEILLAVVPTGGAAALAHYAAVQQNADALSWAALGGAAGLLLGWSGLLWIRARR